MDLTLTTAAGQLSIGADASVLILLALLPALYGLLVTTAVLLARGLMTD
jgi:hypothetical protein